MSKYTTGEVAKLCGVSVRTVQYYDSRAILTPSELSEGGRRLYSEDDLRRMKIICFLRDTGMSINNIGRLLSSEDPTSVISLLIEEQKAELRREIDEQRARLTMLDEVRRELKTVANFSIESIGDIAYSMQNKKKLKRLHATLLILGIPIGILQWGAILLAIMMSIGWPLLVWAVCAVPYGICLSRYYFRKVAYICPQCHTVFRPCMKEAFWAAHTPTLRKLTCPNCGRKGFCVETYGGEVGNRE